MKNSKLSQVLKVSCINNFPMELTKNFKKIKKQPSLFRDKFIYCNIGNGVKIRVF